MTTNLKNIKNKVIAFDIDGVVTDHNYVGKLIQKKYPTFNYTEDMQEYYIENNLHRMGLIPTAKGRKVKREMDAILVGIVEEPKLTPYFKELYNDLIKHNKVVFISARPSKEYDGTMKYLDEKGIDIKREDVYLTSGVDNKFPVLEKLNVDIFVEDKLSTILEYSKLYGKQGYLINTPYNKYENLPLGIERIKDFSVFYSEVEI